MAEFTIKPGTKCLVKQVGGEWTPFRTTRLLKFVRCEVVDNGGRWMFAQGDWRIKVATSLVQAKGYTKPQDATGNGNPGVGTFNKSILGRNGKGANRRRQMLRRR